MNATEELAQMLQARPNQTPYKTTEDFASYVKEEIYKKILSTHEGELPKEEFYELVEDTVKHNELDYAIDSMYPDEVERLVCDGGISHAITLHLITYGTITAHKDVITEKMLLYCLINDILTDTVRYNDFLFYRVNETYRK
jgi:hypothetical protein